MNAIQIVMIVITFGFALATYLLDRFLEKVETPISTRKVVGTYIVSLGFLTLISMTVLNFMY